jgi:acyl-CoA thioesterase
MKLGRRITNSIGRIHEGMLMSSLRQTVESLVQERDDFVIEAPDQWAQGRTLYGGMTAALSYSAIKRALGDLGLLRSAQFTFVGPASGRLRLRSNLLRRGRFSAIVNADCWNEEGMAARSIFVFGDARESQVAHDFTPKVDVPPPESCEPFHKTTKPLKGFLSKFEFRLASGARLFEPNERPEFAIWARFRDIDGCDPVTALLALADALPCAAMVSFPKPAAVSTMTWSVDLHQPLVGSDGWHLLWSVSESTAEGYSLQDMRVYDQDGAPLASGRQVVAIFI